MYKELLKIYTGETLLSRKKLPKIEVTEIVNIFDVQVTKNCRLCCPK